MWNYRWDLGRPISIRNRALVRVFLADLRSMISRVSQDALGRKGAVSYHGCKVQAALVGSLHFADLAGFASIKFKVSQRKS